MKNLKHGWFVLNKPQHMTSMKALSILKRAIGIKKAGHAGTLDPLAYGVLPIAFGEATKLIPYAQDAHKKYRFIVAWGEERTTDDLEGEIVATSTIRPERQEIEAILPQFLGKIMQKPPAFSAIKIDGERAYDLARKGHDIADKIKAKEIEVFALDIVDHQPNQTTFIADVSKGSYVRSFAHDMGRLLGCYGHVVDLERLQVGCFDLKLAVMLDSVYSSTSEYLHSQILPLETVLDDILALAISGQDAAKFCHGQSLNLPNYSDTEIVMVKTENTLLGLACILEGTLIPKRIFNLN
ncbi:MAG: tRNA pseudouridine(55) synthase TruB [Alphaproteobacteria bacterium]|nr:tRNA pseudouridine(55) synthase TruB [Alphaproteobacteria bacterium]